MLASILPSPMKVDLQTASDDGFEFGFGCTHSESSAVSDGSAVTELTQLTQELVVSRLQLDSVAISIPNTALGSRSEPATTLRADGSLAPPTIVVENVQYDSGGGRSRTTSLSLSLGARAGKAPRITIEYPKAEANRAGANDVSHAPDGSLLARVVSSGGGDADDADFFGGWGDGSGDEEGAEQDRFAAVVFGADSTTSTTDAIGAILASQTGDEEGFRSRTNTADLLFLLDCDFLDEEDAVADTTCAKLSGGGGAELDQSEEILNL
jgi:hypothetical protein